MPRRAPIVLSDNSDEDDHSRGHPRKPPRLTASSSPDIPYPAPFRSPASVSLSPHLASPASSVSWNSPRSAPPLTPHHSPPPSTTAQSLSTSASSAARDGASARSPTSLRRELELDIRHLRLQHRHAQLHPPPSQSTPPTIAPGPLAPLIDRPHPATFRGATKPSRPRHPQHKSITSVLEEDDEANDIDPLTPSDPALSQCRTLLSDLSAIAAETERWLTLMRAANARTASSSVPAAS